MMEDATKPMCNMGNGRPPDKDAEDGECMDDVLEDAAKCGFNRCTPKALQRCATIRPFTANVSGLFFVNVAFFTYFLGTIRTLEKRFDLSSTKSSIFLVMMDVVFAFLSLIVGYLGRKSHKPRVMVTCQVMTSIGIFILALPMLIYGPKNPEVTHMGPAANTWPSASLQEMPSQGEINRIIGLCAAPPAPAQPDLNGNWSAESRSAGSRSAGSRSAGSRSAGSRSAESRSAGSRSAGSRSDESRSTGAGHEPDESACDGSDEAATAQSEDSRRAYALLLCGSLLIGLGGVAVSTLGIPYIDENIASSDSACYIGVATSAYSWAPIVGLLLAALCTRIPETLYEDTDLKPSHPSYIGAWWLGMVILGTLSLLLSLPMAMFPKHLHHYYVTRGKRHVRDRAEEDSVGSRMKDFPRLTLKFLTNAPYVTLLVSKICALYGVTGIILQLPRYMEIHYRQPAHMAAIIAAFSGGIMGAVGTVLGGFAMRRLKLDTRGIALMFTIATGCGMLGTAVCMSYGCPQVDMGGSWDHTHKVFSIGTECSSACGCSRSTFRPVCTEDQRTFFSPCHAGCQQVMPHNNTYLDCACGGAAISATGGYCEDDQCQTLIPYILTFLLVSFLVAFGRVPATILMFRLVDEKEKAPIMGLTSFFVNILCFVPSPILFGMLFDSACLVWKSSCSETGACLFYDIRQFRLLMHGTTLGFQLPSFIFAVITLYLVRQKVNNSDKSKEVLALSKQSAVLIGYKQNGHTK